MSSSYRISKLFGSYIPAVKKKLTVKINTFYLIINYCFFFHSFHRAPVNKVRCNSRARVCHELRPDDPVHAEKAVKHDENRYVEHQLADDRADERAASHADRLEKEQEREADEHHRGGDTPRTHELCAERDSPGIVDEQLHDLPRKDFVHEQRE